MDFKIQYITSYYENRSIFLTGATGFVGKVLLEKLLRSFHGVERIYILIRPAKGKSPQERLDKLLESSGMVSHRTRQFQILPLTKIRLILNSTDPKLLGKKPNTYVLSKHLTEVFVEQEASQWNLPICIVRPSIIGPIYKDPIPLEGWTDNVNAMGLVCIGIGNGLHYSTPGDPNICLDLIPVDYVVKILIVAAWEIGIRVEGHHGGPGEVHNRGGVRVYHACIDQFKRIPQGYVADCIKKAVFKTPFSRVARPPSSKMSTRWWWSPLDSLAAGLPCTIIDIIGRLKGQKPRMKQIYERSKHIFRTVSFFRVTKFEFESNNVIALRSKIPSEEKCMFDLEMEELNWEDYVDSCVLGIRRYYYKEDDAHFLQLLKTLLDFESFTELLEEQFPF